MECTPHPFDRLRNNFNNNDRTIIIDEMNEPHRHIHTMNYKKSIGNANGAVVISVSRAAHRGLLQYLATADKQRAC
jgi:hypothetical protein